MILDTNVFNHLVKGEISYKRIPKHFSLFVIPSQKIELDKWNPRTEAEMALKERALADLNEITDAVLPPKTGVWGFFGWGAVPWGAKGKYYDEIFKRLSQNRRKGDSNIHDALIGEAALTYQLELITDDGLLAQIVKDLGGNAFSLKD